MRCATSIIRFRIRDAKLFIRHARVIENLFDLSGNKKWSGVPYPIAAIARAASAIGRLDQALEGHPAFPAILYRARLESVRRMAAADGQLIDPWNFAASLEGLRFRMDGELRVFDRGSLVDAARCAAELHGWIVRPDFDQEGEIILAMKFLDRTEDQGHPLLTAAAGVHGWIDTGGKREPMRAALIRFWTHKGVFRLPVPVTGAGSLRAEVSWEPDRWLPVFLDSVTSEAEAMLQMVYDFGQAWRTARAAVQGRRRDSKAGLAVDLLAAGPVMSATSLARGLGVSVKSALALLDGFLKDGVAIEVTHRSKRRLFALPSLAPLREVAKKPYRPDPTRGPGRRREISDAVELEAPSPALVADATPLPKIAVDYKALETALANADDVMRRTKAALAKLASEIK